MCIPSHGITRAHMLQLPAYATIKQCRGFLFAYNVYHTDYHYMMLYAKMERDTLYMYMFSVARFKFLIDFMNTSLSSVDPIVTIHSTN